MVTSRTLLEEVKRQGIVVFWAWQYYIYVLEEVASYTIGMHGVNIILMNDPLRQGEDDIKQQDGTQSTQQNVNKKKNSSKKPIGNPTVINVQLASRKSASIELFML